MANEKSDIPEKKSYKKPEGCESSITHSGKKISVTADWVVLRKGDKPIAEMFFVSYSRVTAKKSDPTRPLTFIFNGGPGAASAYLHVGALGPYRVNFDTQGGLVAPPSQLSPNTESWLEFSDLVFLDPIGTGFSRVIEEPETSEEKTAPKIDTQKEFFQVNRDLESICECISRLLGTLGRWSSAIFLAGESYGGFRVAKLVRLLQEKFGVGLSGAFLISPALELSALDYSDYNSNPWIDVFPSLSATAHHHKQKGSMRETLSQAERLAQTLLPAALIQGDSLSKADVQTLSAAISKLLNLSETRVEQLGFRISPFRFVRELLRDKKLVCGLYDGSLTTHDPFPDRDVYEGPDVTLSSLDRIFTTAINTLLRETIGLTSDRIYYLLNGEVNTQWKIDFPRHALQTELGATDDLRYGLSLNADLKVFILHGYFDLITPYFASQRLVNMMKLPSQARARIHLENFYGGHMFYTWQASRKALFELAGKAFENSPL